MYVYATFNVKYPCAKARKSGQCGLKLCALALSPVIALPFVRCEQAARSLRKALINFPLFEKNNYLIEIYIYRYIFHFHFRCTLSVRCGGFYGRLHVRSKQVILCPFDRSIDRFYSAQLSLAQRWFDTLYLVIVISFFIDIFFFQMRANIPIGKRYHVCIELQCVTLGRRIDYHFCWSNLLLFQFFFFAQAAQLPARCTINRLWGFDWKPVILRLDDGCMHTYLQLFLSMERKNSNYQTKVSVCLFSTYIKGIINN